MPVHTFRMQTSMNISAKQKFEIIQKLWSGQQGPLHIAEASGDWGLMGEGTTPTTKHQAKFHERLTLPCFSNDFPFPYLSCSCIVGWGVRWGACSSAGVRGRSDRSGWEVINCIFTLLIMFLDHQWAQGKRARGCLFMTCQGMGSLSFDWIMGQVCCRAGRMSCYTSQVVTCPAGPCTLRHAPSAVAISMSFIPGTWRTSESVCSPHKSWAPSALQTVERVIGRSRPDISTGR